MNSCFFILFWLNVYFFLLVQSVDLSPGFLPQLLVPWTFSFISLFIAFTFSSILQPYPTISVSILITSVLNCAYDESAIFSLLSCIFSGALIYSFICAIIFVSVHLLCIRGRSLRCSPGWGNPCCCMVMLYMGERSKREHCHLLSSWLAFNRFLCYPQANLALLVLIPG